MLDFHEVNFHSSCRYEGGLLKGCFLQGYFKFYNFNAYQNKYCEVRSDIKITQNTHL